MKRILVIKLAALGDVVLAFTPLKRIREAHPAAEITVLTTPPFAELFRLSPYVDRVETDGRPNGVVATLKMLWRVRRQQYDRIYDLQTSSRSSAYHLALWPKPPEWSGIAPGASHPHANPKRDRMHTLEREADQLKSAGIWPDAPTAPGTAPSPDLSFLLKDTAPERMPEHFGLQPPYALLVPGASAHRPGKRWPTASYGALALHLQARGLQVAIVGGPAERSLANGIAANVPGVLDLSGRTDFTAVASLGARATLCVGNDTGPTHLIAATGASTVVLFSGESDPALCAPRGKSVQVLRADHLADLTVESVIAAVDGLIPSA